MGRWCFRGDECAEYLSATLACLRMSKERVQIIEAEIAACELQMRTILQCVPRSNKTLIITTGDISDVDGFFALAQYAKTGADVMFVMNYPAYLRITVDECILRQNGLGYLYSTKAMLRETNKKRSEHENFTRYKEALSAYGITDDVINDESILTTSRINAAMYKLLTDMAFQMATNVWREFKTESSQLYFCIGGINDINPFHATSIKSEALVYAKEFDYTMKPIKDATQKSVYTPDPNPVELFNTLESYDSVFLDMNGSAAFYEEEWERSLRNIGHKLHGVVVMGGVYSYKKSATMPAIANNLNRLSCSTMNQLYAPAKTNNFFGTLNKMHIPVYIVANNAVTEMNTVDAVTGKKLDAWEEFLKQNSLNKTNLFAYSNAYYKISPYNPPRKPFDYFTAKIIQHLIDGKTPEHRTEYLIYDKKFGIVLIGTSTDWRNVRNTYIDQCDTKPAADDSDFIQKKKESFAAEQIVLRQEVDSTDHLSVFVVEPVMNPDTFEVTVPLY